jgi:hypothetical protein
MLNCLINKKKSPPTTKNKINVLTKDESILPNLNLFSKTELMGRTKVVKNIPNVSGIKNEEP